MKTRSRPTLMVLTLLVILGIGAIASSRNGESVRHHATSQTKAEAHAEREAVAEAEGEDERNGPEQERWYFEQWHRKYGAVLPQDVVQETWREIDNLPRESGLLAVNAWTPVVPFGMNTVSNPGVRYSGRVLDLESLDGSFRVASASGGLWQAPPTGPVVPLSDGLTSLAIGSFVTVPGTGGNTILVGTGEPHGRTGTGLWMTTDGGATWSHRALSPEPEAFYKIRCTPDNPNIVHAATTHGYFRSDDGGVTWTQYLSGDCSDVAVSSSQYNRVYAGIWGDGLYESTNGGTTWAKITRRLPTTNMGRISISMPSSPNYVYVQVAKNDTQDLLGTWKTVNGGLTWQNVTPATNILNYQGYYDNVIGMCPTNASIALAGGVGLWRTTDGGTTWNQITDPNVHVDQHAILWVDANTVCAGNDGGVCVSTDAGVTWNSSGNTYPITQYVNFGVGVNDAGVIFGGSQDNGFSETTDGGTTWNYTEGGDGGCISIDPSDASRIWGTLGVYSGTWAFRRHRSTDKGQTWDNTINNGIDPDNQWFTKIRNDQVSPVCLYTNSGRWVYKSTDYGSNWVKMNDPLFPSFLSNLNVSRFNFGDQVIYASLGNSTFYFQLRVYTQGAWSERRNGLPSGLDLRGVAPHPTNLDKAYALMTGFNAGQKVYKTTDRRLSWTNISGDLPNVPMGDLVPHPTDDNKLYLGTEFGCYRTTNGGVNWERWNNGMPDPSIVTEMSYIDHLNVDGTFYVLASTYGRGIWKREISGSGPSAVGDHGLSGQPKLAELRNYPNPFTTSTSISFTLAEPERVDLRVYDVSGREVLTLASGQENAGPHTISLDGSKLRPGTYWCRLKDGEHMVTRKIVRVR